jgi:mannose-6-phosphate isomerase-like protein (cupin superfamily)
VTVEIREPRKIPKPWGYELILAHTDRYVGKILHLDPGKLLSRQYHRVKDETIFVLSGTLILEIGAGDAIERTEVPTGQGFRCAPGTVHRFISRPDEPCDLIETSTPELDDVVRIEDAYGREGTSHP